MRAAARRKRSRAIVFFLCVVERRVLKYKVNGFSCPGMEEH